MSNVTKNKTRELPPGWRWVKLGDVCSFHYGSSLIDAARQVGPIPVYGSNGIVGHHNTSVTNGPTIIIGRKGSIGKIHYSPNPCFPIDTTYYIDVTKQSIDMFWLSLTLSQLDLAKLNKASGVPGLNRQDAYKLQFSLPSLAEQQRIGSILKEQMAAVDKARAAAEARLDAVKALPSAFLREVFPRAGAPLPNGWKVAKIGDVATLQGGYAFKSAWFVDKGIRLLRNANIFQNFIDWTDVVSLPIQRRSEFGEYELNEGDIVLALDRPVVAAGLKVARISKDDTPALLLQRVARFKVKAGFSADYLYGFLHTEAFKAAITAHDQSLGVPHVSPSQVESVVIPVPSLAEQRRLAARLRGQMAAAEKARAAAEAELAAVNALPAALLRRAFNGEL